MDQTLHMLVDYDNLDRTLLEIPLSSTVDYLLGRAAGALHQDEYGSCRRARVRLYGGWYEEDELTQRAQDLLRQMSESPRLLRISSRGLVHSWRTSTELATGLILAPGEDLTATMRRRQSLKGIRVADPKEAGCDPRVCRIMGIRDLVRKGRCPDCGTPAERILWRTEQKLVDVMLATDAISLCAEPDALICVVSSDDDLWPAVLHATRVGRRIYHMGDTSGRRVPERYARHARPTYVPIALYEE